MNRIIPIIEESKRQQHDSRTSNISSTLCFDKEVFMKETFDVENFIINCRRKVPIETLRDDLETYLKILQSSMVELINKDYADYVNLSTNLVGLDKAINNLTTPLGQFKEEVADVKQTMDKSVSEMKEKLESQQKIKQQKIVLGRLLNIIESVDKIERLLGLQASSNSTNTTIKSSNKNRQLMERIATEFNKLQFYVNRCRDLPLVTEVRPRLTNITTSLQYNLEDMFKEGLTSNPPNHNILTQCLRAYALIDKIKEAENLFRIHVAQPYLTQYINEDYLNIHGLDTVYARILDFIPSKFKVFREITSASNEKIHGFDFLINSFWPELIVQIEYHMSSIFAPGNPDAFHKKYSVTMDFLNKFESFFSSKASVKQLRSHEHYTSFMTKWSLPVYYQIRFQELAGDFEMSIATPFLEPKEKSDFKLNVSHVMWNSLGRCWHDDVFLSALTHRFWKLTLQLFSRYSTWINEIYSTQICPNNKTLENGEEPNKLSSDNNSFVSSTSATSSVSAGVSSDKSISTPQLLSLLTDMRSTSNQIPLFYTSTILPKVEALNVNHSIIFEECLSTSSNSIMSHYSSFIDFFVENLSTQCSASLKLISDIPRLYRRTNREVPNKPSPYVSSVLKPLHSFMDEYKVDLAEDWMNLSVKVIESTTLLFLNNTTDVLTSIKKTEESLKRLKKGRSSITGVASSSNITGMSDDDKIRHQLQLDYEYYNEQIVSLGIETSLIDSLKKLKDVINQAIISSSLSSEKDIS